jgi:hypothetical protein
MDPIDVVTWALGISSQVKLLHWATASYAVHKALDGLGDALGALADRFVEVYMGRYGHRGTAFKNAVIVSKAHGDATKWEDVLEGMRAAMVTIHAAFAKAVAKPGKAGGGAAPELTNIVEEMMAAVDQALYLGRLA